MSIADVTVQFEGVHPYDRLYRCESGCTVKVRVVDTTTAPGSLSFRITGSWVDPETADARPFGDGWFIVDPHDLIVRSDTPVNLTQTVEAARIHVVRRVEIAAINHAAKEALTGILKS